MQGETILTLEGEMVWDIETLNWASWLLEAPAVGNRLSLLCGHLRAEA